MIENRRHFRIREFIDVVWKVDGQEVSGEGMLINMSSSGLLLQTDQAFSPTDDCVMSIATEMDGIPVSKIKGKIIWFRRIHTPQERIQCGIQLLAGNLDNKFQQWLEMKISQISQAGDANILGNMAL